MVEVSVTMREHGKTWEDAASKTINFVQIPGIGEYIWVKPDLSSSPAKYFEVKMVLHQILGIGALGTRAWAEEVYDFHAKIKALD